MHEGSAADYGCGTFFESGELIGLPAGPIENFLM